MDNKTLEEFFPIISDYAKILVPSFITYFATRYTLNRPRKYEIREKQFTLVYLPLYLLTKQLISDGKYSQNIDLYFRKVNKIIYKNYQYVFPKTIKLFDKMKSEWQNGNHNVYHISYFEIQLESDYEKLKRELGYPTNSIIDFFKRLSWFNKLCYLITLFSFLLALFFTASAFLFLLDGDILKLLKAIILCIVSYFYLYSIYLMRH